MQVTRRTFGRWKPGHKDIKTQIVIERGDAVLLRFNINEVDEVEEMGRDLLREAAEWREDYAKTWREKLAANDPRAQDKEQTDDAN
jgi:hypothetical protein